MSPPLSPRQADLRALIDDFLNRRRDEKLDKLKAEDPKREALRADFQREAWLADAARRVEQIQAVTHSLKPIHPDARGTNLYLHLEPKPDWTVVGSHCLGNTFDLDIVGNAAALDVYKLLKLEHEGKTLLTLACENDEDLAAAFGGEPEQAKAWVRAFARLVEPRRRPASHTLAKQLYWPTGRPPEYRPDPHDDNAFHLLAPLYASALAHRVHLTIREHRFGDEAKAARADHRANRYNPAVIHEYPKLAIQKLGGTKPQNISQLNSERRGENYLLASLPPNWVSREISPLLHVDSMMIRYARRPDVRRNVKALKSFLEADPKPNAPTRQHRSALVDDLIDEFLQFSAELRMLPAGWSRQPECRLGTFEKHWLDPDGADPDSPRPEHDQIVKTIAGSWSSWLNSQLRKPLEVGDDEFRAWRKEMVEQIAQDERERDDDR